MVNRDIILQPSMILSQDTMPQDDRFSQSPGVCLGRALLSFVGHSVSCKTGWYNMNFIFDTKNELVANIRIMRQRSINEFKRSVAPRASELIPFIPSPKTDTIFTIGGGKSSSRKVTQRELDTWCETALFLQNIKDDDIVKTDMGDLILDSKFQGKLYLKGFLLSETNKTGFASLSEKRLSCDYNIFHGTPDAKRKHMSSLEQECQGIMSI
ncbi:hypothetical protein F53441_526 [Fusarium austroafricanum]|uniref:Uncharacterized protein n=1 Tax=Fusarium austroafricanum TaxID=2364996 RepID=A0A8H4KVF0_9HYPO|nr:hypothetical protein F53441_526 [Fusarium austroafricanum]